MFTAVILLVLLCTPSRGSPTPRDNFPVYSITLDPMSNLRLDWTVDHHQEHINVQLLAEDLPPQSWLAVGFSDRGDWSSAHLCVAWEDWKGFFHVQVISIFRSEIFSSLSQVAFKLNHLRIFHSIHHVFLR